MAARTVVASSHSLRRVGPGPGDSPHRVATLPAASRPPVPPLGYHSAERAGPACAQSAPRVAPGGSESPLCRPNGVPTRPQTAPTRPTFVPDSATFLPDSDTLLSDSSTSLPDSDTLLSDSATFLADSAAHCICGYANYLASVQTRCTTHAAALLAFVMREALGSRPARPPSQSRDA